jgi:hypothetical protein
VSGGSYANGYVQASAWVAARTPGLGEVEHGDADPLESAFSDERVAWLKERGSYLALGAGAKGTLNKLRLVAAYAGTLLAHWASLLAFAFFVGCAVATFDPLFGHYLPSALRILLFAGVVTFVFRLLLSQVSDRAAIAGTRVEGVLSLFETAVLAPLLVLGGFAALGSFVPWALLWPQIVADWARAAAQVAPAHVALGAGLAFVSGTLVQWSTGERATFFTRLGHCLWSGFKYLAFVLLAFGSARAMRGLGWLRRNARTIQVFGGVLLILVGLALLTGLWADFVSWVRDAFVSDVRLPL